MTTQNQNQTRESVACLACGSKHFELFREIRNLDPNTEHLIANIAVSVCQNCGLIFQNPCIPEKRMDELYEVVEDKIIAAGGDTVTVEENKHRLDALQLIQPPPARILEIGCSDGTFMNLARLAGYEVVGIDPSRPNCENALLQYPELDVRCLFLDGFESGEQFDVICHFFVFEHVFHPDQFLGQIKSLLRSGGLMYFEIPDVESFGKLPFANNLFTYQHTAHYSPSTVRAVLGKNGFNTLGVNGSFGHSPKSYGMRVIAASIGGIFPIETNFSEQSRDILVNYFMRRDGLLEKIENRVQAWLKETIDLPGPIVIFGAGENGRILRSTSVMGSGRELYFCDNSVALHGRKIEGVEVLSPNLAASLKPALVIAASIDYQNDMARQMASLGVPADRIVKLYEDF